MESAGKVLEQTQYVDKMQEVDSQKMKWDSEQIGIGCVSRAVSHPGEW